MRIRRLVPTDIAAADQVLRAAFAVEKSFEARLRRYLAVQPDGWLVAEDESGIIGTVGAVDYGQFAYVGLMAVLPVHQGRRIGQTLLSAVLSWLQVRGITCSVLDATESGAPLYQKLGFVSVGVSHQFVLPPQPAGGAAAADMKVEAATGSEEIIALDHEFFGSDRTPLWRRLFAEEPGRLLVARTADGELGGYLCAQEHSLGPWGARTAAIAGDLIRAAAPWWAAVGTRVIVPGENTAAAALCAAHGGQLVTSLRHMRRGPGPSLRGWAYLYGKGSYCVG